MEADDLRFYDELSKLIEQTQRGRVVFGLTNAEKILVTDLGMLSLGRNVVAVYEDDGNVILFPFERIVTAQVLTQDE